MIEVSIYIKDHYIVKMDAEYYEGPAKVKVYTGDMANSDPFLQYDLRKGDYVRVDWKSQSVKIVTDDKAVIFKADAIRIENPLE